MKWLESYEPGVPHTILPEQYISLVALVEAGCKQFADRPCYINFGVTLTYQQLDTLTQAFAGFLQTTSDLALGDRIAIMLPNLLQYPVVMWGTLRAGMSVVNINPQYTPREVHAILKDSSAKCVVLLAHLTPVLAAALPDTQVKQVIITEIGDLLGFKGKLMNVVMKHFKYKIPSVPFDLPVYPFKATLGLAYRAAFKRVEVAPTALAFLQYTGGTTGESKGAMLTHRNMIANLLQVAVWFDPFLIWEKGNVEKGIITALPLYHVFSLLANCLTFFKIGIPNILITDPRDTKRFVKTLKHQPFSLFTGVSTLFNALLHNKEFCRLDFSQLKFALGGGMAVQKEVAMRWKEITGILLFEGYGLTEASPVVTVNPLSLTTFNGSIGLPLPSTEVKIVDEQDRILPINEVGELCVRGPQVMQGYWNQPEKTKEVLQDGWLRTGDIARMDQAGFIYLVDRKKDLIIVSGFNVYPSEIEKVIVMLPGVREVAVIGVPSQADGEVVKAFIVREDRYLEKKAILAHCHQYLMSYKIPKKIEFCSELLKSNVGKVLKRMLRSS